MNLVITGTSSGIGRSLTEHLLSSGHSVWGIARSDQSEFAAQYPVRFRASRCDVSSWSDVEATAREVTAAWLHVDALIACAGVQGEIGRAVAADPIKWSQTVSTNLDGTYYPIRAFHPLLMKASGRAKIICFSGGGATKPRANFSAYGAAKTAIVRLVENIADEEKSTRLDINAIAPGAINTRLTDEVIAQGPHVVGETEYQAALKQKASGGGSLAKVNGLVDWLISTASDGVSGRLLAAPWDPWATLGQHAQQLAQSDVYTLRRIVPEERGLKF